MFNILTGLFDRVVLRTNISKHVGMVCQPCQAARVRLDEAYTRQMMGEGRIYQEKHQEQVHCPECGKDLLTGSLASHCQNQHGVARGGSGQEGDEKIRVDKPRTFRRKFPAKEGPRPCQVEGCSGRATTQTSMRVHFWHRHVRDTVVILEEGNLPHS